MCIVQCLKMCSTDIQFHFCCIYTYIQVEEYTAMLTLVLAVNQFFWMMSSAPQVPASYWGVLADQSCPTTVTTLTMLVWGVKVCGAIDQYIIACEIST